MFNSLKKWFGKKGAEAPLDATSLACHPTLCMMPWVHLHVTQTGHVTPCCQAPWQAERAFGSVNESAVAEIWNGNAIKKFRKNMLAGKPDPRCQACYDKEKDGFRSLRHVTNQDYGHHVDLLQATAPSGHLPEAKPIYLDIRFSNICNFKCRICG
ncbi:MAG TPA: hypothetical protein ENJ82_02285, partial [Bacteroidetes bacterium]|nr:hypothetical protein [Bacteroidota bacterium]